MAGHLVIVPTRALYDPQLQKSPATFKALCLLSTFASTKDGWCFLLMSTIAEHLDISTRMARKHIQKLEKLGYVQRKPRFRKGSQISSEYRVILDAPISRGAELEVPGVPEPEVPGRAELEVPTERSSLNDKERESPLSREGFLRGVDKVYQGDGFGDEFIHLTETEIKEQAEECWDRWGGNLKGTNPKYILRSWMRKGVKLGTVRKKPAEKSIQESGGEIKEPSNPLQEWHDRARQFFDQGTFNSWIRPLEWDGNGQLFAPSKFHADYTNQHHIDDLSKILHDGVKAIPKPPKEQTLCTK